MQRLSMLGSATLLILGLAAAPLHGQLRPWEISIAGGPTFPTGDLADVAGTGYHVQGSVGFGVPMLPFGVRADAFWNEVPDEVDDGWFRQVGGLVNATFGIPLIIVEPYALAGVGFLRTDAPDDGDSENIVGFNAGGGIEFPFMGLSGFLEAKYLNIFGGGTATNFQSIPVTFGVRF